MGTTHLCATNKTRLSKFNIMWFHLWVWTDALLILFNSFVVLFSFFLLKRGTAHGCKGSITIRRREPHLIRRTDEMGGDNREPFGGVG